MADNLRPGSRSPRSAATSSRPTRRSRCGRPRRSRATRCRRCWRRREPATPLGLYLHIPFCRKRCHFCYFRVYTDKNAQEIGQYLDVLGREWEMYAAAAGDCRAAAELRLLRRRHAVVSVDRAAPGAGRRPDGGDAVEPGRRDHVRVRAGHADAAQADGDPQDGRHAPEPRRRELRRSHPRDQRPRAPLARDRAPPTASRARSTSRRSTSI